MLRKINDFTTEEQIELETRARDGFTAFDIIKMLQNVNLHDENSRTGFLGNKFKILEENGKLKELNLMAEDITDFCNGKAVFGDTLSYYRLNILPTELEDSQFVSKINNSFMSLSFLNEINVESFLIKYDDFIKAVETYPKLTVDMFAVTTPVQRDEYDEITELIALESEEM